MALRLHHIVLDAHDLPGLARFGRRHSDGGSCPRVNGRSSSADDAAPLGMCFMPVTDAKTIKNRVHLDLTTAAEDRHAEIERILALGARTVDIGQSGDESWTVLADPEGNEFCVVRPKTTLVG
jgi:hypothetical protein